MALGTKDRITRSKGFCESQKELMSLVMEFELEDLWRRQNPNGHLYAHFHDRNNTFSRIDRAYTSANMRVGVKIDHEINTFSDHFQTIVIKREPTSFKRGKGYWILDCGLLQGKEYIGSNKGNTEKSVGFKWNSDTTKILGYTYGHNTIQTRERNWEKVRKKIREDIWKWGHLPLPLIGKKILINQVMLSKIW